MPNQGVSSNPEANNLLNEFKQNNPQDWWSDEKINEFWNKCKNEMRFDHDVCYKIWKHMKKVHDIKNIEQGLIDNSIRYEELIN